MCERCSKILEAIDAAKMRAKSEHRDLLRIKAVDKSREADAIFHALRRLQIEIAKIG